MQRQDQRMLIEICNDINWHFNPLKIQRTCSCLALAMILSPLVVNGHKAPPYSNATSLLLLDHCLDLDLHFFPIVLDHMATPFLVLFDLFFPVHVQLLTCLGPQFLPLWNQTPKRKALKAQGRVLCPLITRGDKIMARARHELIISIFLRNKTSIGIIAYFN